MIIHEIPRRTSSKSLTTRIAKTSIISGLLKMLAKIKGDDMKEFYYLLGLCSIAPIHEGIKDVSICANPYNAIPWSGAEVPVVYLVRATSFNYGNGGRGTLYEPGCDGQSRSTATNDNVVKDFVFARRMVYVVCVRVLEDIRGAGDWNKSHNACQGCEQLH